MCVQKYMTINHWKRHKQYGKVLLYIFLAAPFFSQFYLYSQSSLSHAPRPPFCPHPFTRFIYHHGFVFLPLLLSSLFLFYFFLASILSAVCCCLWNGNVCVKAQPLKLLLFRRCCLCFGIAELRVEWEFLPFSPSSAFPSRHSFHFPSPFSSPYSPPQHLISSLLFFRHSHFSPPFLSPPVFTSPSRHLSCIPRSFTCSRHCLFPSPLTSLFPLSLTTYFPIISAPSLASITAHSSCHLLSWPSLPSFLHSSAHGP